MEEADCYRGSMYDGVVFCFFSHPKVPRPLRSPQKVVLGAEAAAFHADPQGKQGSGIFTKVPESSRIFRKVLEGLRRLRKASRRKTQAVATAPISLSDSLR